MSILYRCGMASTLLNNIPVVGPRKQILCIDHPDEKVSFACKDCHRLICDTCVEGKHKQHEFKSLKNAVREIEKNMKINEDDLKSLISIFQRRGTMHRDYNSLISAIDARATHLVTNIERLRDHMKDECLRQKDREDQYHDDYESVYHPMMQKFDEIEKLLQNAGVHNHAQICQAQLDFDDKHEVVANRASGMNIITPKFVTGKDDITEHKKIFGNLEYDSKLKGTAMVIARENMRRNTQK